jgi:hypothetical protein
MGSKGFLKLYLKYQTIIKLSFCERDNTLDLSYLVAVKSTMEISKFFVAFSEYMNFIFTRYYVVSKRVNFLKLYSKHVAGLVHKYGPVFVRFFILK